MKYCKFFTGFILFSILLSACQKELSNEEIVQKGNWEFRLLENIYSGPLDTVFIKAGKMQILGKSTDQTHTFNLILTSSTGVFLPGSSYNASAQEAEMNYSLNNNSIFMANSMNGEFIVSINLITETFVSGTFSGIAIDSTGKKQQIIQGKFSSNYGIDILTLPK